MANERHLSGSLGRPNFISGFLSTPCGGGSVGREYLINIAPGRGNDFLLTSIITASKKVQVRYLGMYQVTE